MTDPWRIDNNGSGETVSIYMGDRLIADVYDEQDGVRIVRAMNWDFKAGVALMRLRDKVEQFCRAFETSSLPGGSLIVGDLRNALKDDGQG